MTDLLNKAQLFTHTKVPGISVLQLPDRFVVLLNQYPIVHMSSIPIHSSDRSSKGANATRRRHLELLEIDFFTLSVIQDLLATRLFDDVIAEKTSIASRLLDIANTVLTEGSSEEKTLNDINKNNTYKQYRVRIKKAYIKEVSEKETHCVYTVIVDLPYGKFTEIQLKQQIQPEGIGVVQEMFPLLRILKM